MILSEKPDSSVAKAGRPGFDSRQGEIFLFSTATRGALEPTQALIQWSGGGGGKRRGRGADQSNPVQNSVVVRYLHSSFT
jgi:hypothetical protein